MKSSLSPAEHPKTHSDSSIEAQVKFKCEFCEYDRLARQENVARPMKSLFVNKHNDAWLFFARFTVQTDFPSICITEAEVISYEKCVRMSRLAGEAVISELDSIDQ